MNIKNPHDQGHGILEYAAMYGLDRAVAFSDQVDLSAPSTTFRAKVPKSDFFDLDQNPNATRCFAVHHQKL